MVKHLRPGRYLSFPSAQNVEDVLPQLISVATRYGLNDGRIKFLAILHRGALDCVQGGDCGRNAASPSAAISHELYCVRPTRDLHGFSMMPGPATEFTVRAGRL
jgi:hypothetical protein